MRERWQQRGVAQSRMARAVTLVPILLIAPLFLSVSTSGLAVPKSGQPAKDQARDYTIRTDVRLVLLDVSVAKRDGGIVGGLAKDNFRVFDNGQPMDISVFANKDVPVTVGVVVDESLSMWPKRANVLAAALAFIEASNHQDEVFVLNFNDTVHVGLPHNILFSDNITQLRDALNSGHSGGKTALYDAVVAGLKQLELGKRDKKTLIVISDGGDNTSKATRQEMLDLVGRSFATIYTIGIFSEGDPDKDPGILTKLAKMTGGLAYFPESLAGMLPVCRAIAADIRTRYTIGYTPPATATNTRHRIKVEVSSNGQSGLRVRTRTGYWNEPPAAETAQSGSQGQ
jgi:Ca-activated chloride channel family protein